MSLLFPETRWGRLPEVTLGLLAIAGAVLWWAFCRPTPTPIPPKEQATADSLAATKPDYQRRVDTLVRRETTYVAVSRQNRAGSIETAHRADSLRNIAIVADSVARAERDTSSLWRRAADAWHSTADSLRVAVVHLGIAYSAESTARVNATMRADEAQRRSAAIEEFSSRLASDLRKAQPPCQLVPHVVGCPSRKVAFATGVLAPPLFKLARNLLAGDPPLRGVTR